MTERKAPVSFTVPFHHLSIPNLHIQRLCGFKDMEAPEPFPELIEACLKEAARICDIKVGYVVIDQIETIRESKQIIVRDILGKPVYFEVKSIVYQQLKRAEKLIVFLCTAGPALEQWSKKLMEEGDQVAGYVVDVIGSEVVEAAMESIQDEFEKDFEKQGLKITNSYGPGYCNWHVSEQKKLFQLLPKNFCGVQLLPSSLMQPSKTISGFIGVGQKVTRMDSKCSVCDSEGCIYRGLR
jgi:hypothetical protein